MTPKTVLIVDDDTSIREILATQLARLHYNAVTAADGEEAVVLFKKEKPDVILMDMMMPRMDGLAACQKIRSLEKKGVRTPIIFLTARDTQHDKLSSQISGGDDFVIKPISLKELQDRLETALRHRRKA